MVQNLLEFYAKVYRVLKYSVKCRFILLITVALTQLQRLWFLLSFFASRGPNPWLLAILYWTNMGPNIRPNIEPNIEPDIEPDIEPNIEPQY